MDNDSNKEGKVVAGAEKHQPQAKKPRTQPAPQEGEMTIVPLREQSSMLETNKKNRRLDSLARLLEGKGTCTAILTHHNTLLIAANDIHDGTTDNNELLNYLTDVFSYFLNLSKQQEVATTTRESIFSKICLSLVKSEDKGSIRIADFAIKNIALFFLQKGKETKESVDKMTLNEIANIAFGKNYSQLGSIATQANLMKSFPIIAMIATDFKKSESCFKKKKAPFDHLESHHILKKNEEAGIHAEMRLLNHALKIGLLQASQTTKKYIGISKLCCPKCELVIKSLNQVLASEKIETESAISELLEKRGEHGILSPKNKWILPPFLCGKDTAQKKAFISVANTCIADTKEKEKHSQFIDKLTDRYLENAAIINSVGKSDAEREAREKLIKTLGLKQRTQFEDMRAKISESDASGSDSAQEQSQDTKSDEDVLLRVGEDLEQLKNSTLEKINTGEKNVP